MTPRDIVLIPAYRRPEFLWHCLQNLRLADHASEHHYIFRFDHGHSPELFKVIEGWPFPFEVCTTQRVPYRLAKQSYSLLSGYEIAAQRSGSPWSMVYMVEEDVMVARDFFRWHREVHRQNEALWCSAAVANPNRKVQAEGSGGDYYLTTDDYCSLGVCYRARVITDLIAPEVTRKYYVDPINDIKRRFPGSPFGDAFAEQDGLIRRLQWRQGLAMPLAYPVQPKAYHAGFYGKNRGSGPAGSLEDRKRRLAEIIYSDEAMRTFAKHPEWYEDSRPVNLNPEPWTEAREIPVSL